jgi:hypothetical protein
MMSLEFVSKFNAMFALLILLPAGSAVAAYAQFPASPHTQGSSSAPSSRNNDADMDKRMSANTQEKMAIARNDERQKRLVSDTDKLVALVTQLKTDVDKTDKYMLSLEVVRRSEEIEKLARSIKERAKN